MKKYFLFSIILFLTLTIHVYATDDKNTTTNTKETVTLSSCVDGDTAKFVTSKGIESTRFLAIDTPEVDTNEAYSEEASTFTCNALTAASTIVLEYDTNSDRYDKYNRLLAWVWVDNTLLQDEIIKGGLGEVAFLYGDYSYTSTLQADQATAQDSKLGIWADNDEIATTAILDKSITNNSENKWFELVYLIFIAMTIATSIYFKNHRTKLNFINIIFNSDIKLSVFYRNKVIKSIESILNMIVIIVLIILYMTLILPVIYDFVLLIINVFRKQKRGNRYVI